MRKRAPKSYISLIEDMYDSSKQRVKSMFGITKVSEVRVDVHNGLT